MREKRHAAVQQSQIGDQFDGRVVDFFHRLAGTLRLLSAPGGVVEDGAREVGCPSCGARYVHPKLSFDLLQDR